jgi:hypothetical protein
LTTYACGYGYRDHAVWANCQAGATADTVDISQDGNNACRAKEDGGYSVGRTFLFFDLSRAAGVVQSLSLYIRLDNGTNLSDIIVKKYSGTSPDLNSSDDPFVVGDYDEIGVNYSAAVDLAGGSSEDWVELPLNATAITDINAAIGNADSSAIFSVMLREYSHDDQNVPPPNGETHDCNMHLDTAGEIPYLSMTMATTPEIMKIFQWSKGRISERHLFAQIEGGDLIESTDEPPTVTTGDFGTVINQPRDVDAARLPLPVLTIGYGNQVPASFGAIHDNLLYADGISQHSVWTGQNGKIDTFKKVDGSGALDDNPGDGIDYSIVVSDSDPETYADLSSFGDLTNDFQAFFIKTRFKAKQFNFTVRTPNGTAATLKMKTWDKVAGWQARTIVDGTSVSAKTLNRSGSVTFTPDAEEIEFYAFGENGYWYMFYLDDAAGDLDGNTTVSEVTYEGEWQSLENVWNGVLVGAEEAYHWSNSDDVYYHYSGVGVDLSSFTHSVDYLYVSSIDNLVGLHFNFGATPNTFTATVVTQVDGWDGTQWVDLEETDGTEGWNASGFITWKRNADLQKREFEGSRYSAYWWKITLGTASTSTDVVATILTLPWYDIADHGAFGRCNAVWKERACYSFGDYPSWLYVTENSAPNVLNGSDYAVLQAGDGRQNSIVAMAKFHNELVVWQEERGRDGGCLTLFEGYSPSTFGKLLLSAKIGSFSQKSVVVIDGANSFTRKDDNQQTLAFFISHYGIFVTDGSIVTRISDDIQNYFDLRFTECIRRGYEKQMFVEHDTSSNVLRFGLVSGSSATQCNIFPVFDLTDWNWSFDILGQAHSHVHEVEASSGQYPVIQVAGSTNGFIYKINDNSVKTDGGVDIDMIVRPEFNSASRHLDVSEIVVRALPVTGSSFTMEVFEDGVENTDAQLTISTDDPADGQDLIRERAVVDLSQASNISIKLRSNNDEDCYLYDFNLDMVEELER